MVTSRSSNVREHGSRTPIGALQRFQRKPRRKLLRNSPDLADARTRRRAQRKVPRGRDDERRLTADTIELAQQYRRYGYRKVAALLRQAGWIINDKRVERIWRREVSMCCCVGKGGR